MIITIIIIIIIIYTYYKELYSRKSNPDSNEIDTYLDSVEFDTLSEEEKRCYVKVCSQKKSVMMHWYQCQITKPQVVTDYQQNFINVVGKI